MLAQILTHVVQWIKPTHIGHPTVYVHVHVCQYVSVSSVYVSVRQCVSQYLSVYQFQCVSVRLDGFVWGIMCCVGTLRPC